MRGSKAKKLRKIIYGDMSLKRRNYQLGKNNNIEADYLRQSYQEEKGR